MHFRLQISDWRFGILICVYLCASAVPLHAQEQLNPRIGYVFPAGGRVGTEFDVAIGGKQLDGVNGARITGTGIRAYVSEYVKPISQGQASLLREKLIALEEKRYQATGIRPPGYVRREEQATTKPTTKPKWTMADDLAMIEIRKKLATIPRRATLTPAIADTAIVHITIEKNAEVGQREVRLRTPSGFTNPLVFHVGQLPEFREADVKTGGAIDTNVRVPCVINGQILPGEIDKFRFKAIKGQKLVIAVAARALIPYLPDAVPGWFQATISLHDATGAELAFAGDYRFNPDPVLYYRIEKDGDYVLRIHDSIYRGREDFVYRITLGEVPFITSIYPLGGRAGALTNVDVWGWNLPRIKLVADGKEPGVQLLSMSREEWQSNQVPFMLGSLPEIAEHEPNSSPTEAQKVSLPVGINGRINYAGDWDVYRFDGRAGEEIVAEVHARRLNSPLDSIVKITDAGGKQLALNDDHEDRGSGLTTHHADSYLRFKLPADGTYFVHIGDTQNKGGPEYGYRLRLSAPRPDFELRVVPSNINVRAGATIPITVFAMRKDGFDGRIEVSLKNAPKFALGGAAVPEGQESVRMTLTAPSSLPRDPFNLVVEGRATIGAEQVIRMAAPAEDMMQAFAYRHLVTVNETLVTPSARGAAGLVMKPISETPMKIVAGGTGRVLLNIPTNRGEVGVTLNDPPDGLTVRSVSVAAQGQEVVIAADAAKIKAGVKGNLLMNAHVETTVPGADGAAPTKRRNGLGLVQAVPFEIVAQ